MPAGVVAFAACWAFLIVLSMVQVAIKWALVLPMIVGCAFWVAWDSGRVGMRSYRTAVALHPVLLWFWVLLLWPMAFPWYLAARYRLKRGTLARKP
jgi:hypothetical protein